MRFNHIRIGDIVEEYKQACGVSNLTVWDISGINKDKEFFEPSKQVGADTSNYRIVPPNYFACNLMHVGRDIVLPISLNTTENNKIVSPAYTTFKLTNNDELLNEYFFIWLKSPEKDRFFWLFTDASVRDGLAWEDFCNIEIDVPSIDIQSKYVAVYKAMLANQQAYEQGLDELKLACDIAVEKIKKNSELIKVDELVEEIDNRNIGGKIMNLQGINITKNFMPSLAKINKKNIEKYKVVNKNEFAYSAMQTGRDECIRIALYGESEPCIVSPAYSVLAVKSPKILPEYFMKWFSRKESDRHGAFISDSSVRASLDLSEFLGVEIPVPDLDIQKSIVDIYKVYLERKAISEKLKEQIKNICPVLIKGATDEAKKLATAS